MVQIVTVAVVLLGVAFLVVVVTLQQEGGARPPIRVRVRVMAWRIRSGLAAAVATLGRGGGVAVRSLARWSSSLARWVRTTARAARKGRPAGGSATGRLRDGQVEGDGSSIAGGLGAPRAFESPGRPFEVAVPVPPSRSRSGRSLPELLPYRGRHRARLQFGQTLEVTEVGPAPAPGGGLFGEGAAAESRPARGLSVLRLVLVMMLAGAAVGMLLLGVVFGIKGLVG